jgi:hypothetical protein
MYREKTKERIEKINKERRKEGINVIISESCCSKNVTVSL